MTQTVDFEQVFEKGTFCKECNDDMVKTVAEWETTGGEKPIWHPIMGSPIHFITDFAMKFGMGGTLCGSRQGYIE